LVAPHIKFIATEPEHSQSRYSFFEVVYSLYSSDVGIKGLLSISMGGLEEGFRKHSSKPSTKSHRR